MSDFHGIEFTQYLRPHGRRTSVWFHCSDDIERKAQRIIEAGWCFEAEVLLTGAVSLTITAPEKEIDLFVEVVPNGPEVPEAVERLVEKAYDSIQAAEWAEMVRGKNE